MSAIRSAYTAHPYNYRSGTSDRPARIGVSIPSERSSRPVASVGGVRVVHESGEAKTTLASDVETADSFVSRARGLMFRRSVPEGYALVFEFDGRGRRDVHMVFVPFPIDVLWLVDGRVERVETLPAWRGLGAADADRLVELPADAASDVEVGDAVRVER